MAIFKCKMCGGELELQKGMNIAECPYCGTKQTVFSNASITKDKIFLLSDEDVKKYFKNTTDRVCENTPYSNSVMRGYESSWWLRTKDNTNSTKNSSFVIIVHSNGTIGSRYSSDYMSLSSFSYCGVRPAMWIDLSKT